MKFEALNGGEVHGKKHEECPASGEAGDGVGLALPLFQAGTTSFTRDTMRNALLDSEQVSPQCSESERSEHQTETAEMQNATAPSKTISLMRPNRRLVVFRDGAGKPNVRRSTVNRGK